MAAERKWALFGALVLLIIIGTIAVDKFWLYPRLSVQIQPVPRYTPPDETITAVVIKPFEGTLRKIIQYNLANGANGDDVVTEDERCPFLWEGELEPKIPPHPEKKVQPVEIPRLAMIIIGDTGKTAMLDTTLVHPGEAYGGHVVEDIESEYVILSGDYGVLKISMPVNSYGAPLVDILEETNPNLLIKPVFSEKK